MTAYQYRQRHPKTVRAVIIAVVVAALVFGAYQIWATRLPARVCVSAKPGSALAPAGRVAASRPGLGQPAPSVPDISLSGLSWTDYQGYELPVSAQGGPRDTAGGLASGYADTPLGALLAAVNIAARTSWQFGPGVFGPTISSQVTGQFAGEMLSGDQSSYDQGAAQSQAGQAGARQVAFSFEDYTPSTATVDVVTGAPGAQAYVITQIHVEWLHGDWRVLAPPGGDWADSAAQVSSTAGFTAFPGQGA